MSHEICSRGPVCDWCKHKPECDGSSPAPEREAVERIAQIRRRVPGLMHQWYGQDVPFLLAALAEANSENAGLREIAAQCQRERNDMWHERDRAVAQVQRALALCDEYEGADGTDCDDLARRFRAALAGQDNGGRATAQSHRADAVLRKACENCRACETCVLA